MKPKQEYKIECYAGGKLIFDFPVRGKRQMRRLRRVAKKKDGIVCETSTGKTEVVNFALITRTTISPLEGR